MKTEKPQKSTRPGRIHALFWAWLGYFAAIFGGFIHPQVRPILLLLFVGIATVIFHD